MTLTAGIDPKEAREMFSISSYDTKIATPKATKFSALQGKAELSVTYKVGTKLKEIWQRLEGDRCYAVEDCIDHILSGEEIADRADPNRGTDAFMYTQPELDETKVAPIEQEEKLDRFAWFVAVVNKVAQKDMLAFILENAPKKKNGTFAKNKITVIAALPIVFGVNLAYYEIVGKATTDNRLDISVQERRLSEDEWVRSKDTVYLQYLSSGKDPSSKCVLKKIKISHKHYGSKTTIEIPAIQLEDGTLAIDAKPYRPISGFSCVKGNDQKGYEILEPERPAFDTVCYHGRTDTLRWVLPESPGGISSLWSYLEEPSKYIRTGKKTYLMRTEIFTGTRKGEKIPERCLTENYIAEIAYQLLCTIEGINKFLTRPSLASEIADKIKRNEDGSPIIYGGSDMDILTAPGREVPLVSGQIILRTQSNGEVNVWYSLSMHHGADWSEYEEK